MSSTTLSIFFEGPYWVAILEQVTADKLRAARYVFGSEPSDPEVYEFIDQHYADLLTHLSEPIPISEHATKQINPKRQQRLIQKQINESHSSTKAQEALRLQLETNKKAKQQHKKRDREALQAFKRAQKIQKRKEKHRGH